MGPSLSCYSVHCYSVRSLDCYNVRRHLCHRLRTLLVAGHELVEVAFAKLLDGSIFELVRLVILFVLEVISGKVPHAFVILDGLLARGELRMVHDLSATNLERPPVFGDRVMYFLARAANRPARCIGKIKLEVFGAILPRCLLLARPRHAKQWDAQYSRDVPSYIKAFSRK